MSLDFATKATAATLAAVWVANSGASAFVSVSTGSQAQNDRTVGRHLASAPAVSSLSIQDTIGMGGLLAYGASFGALFSLAQRSRSRVQRKADLSETITAPQPVAIEKIAWLKGFPPTLMDKRRLQKFLEPYVAAGENVEEPEEDTPLYLLKAYAEAYGEGKATKMTVADWVQFKNRVPTLDSLADWAYPQDLAPDTRTERQKQIDGDSWNNPDEQRVFIPGNFGVLLDLGPWVKFRGQEPFAGDQLQTVVSAGGLSKTFVQNWAFYREGLKPWQRGLEIGMGHGYFIIGPFISLGPLRFTPEAATVGLLAGATLIIAVSIGGLIFGATEKPALFDQPGKMRASGFQELIWWHMFGGIGGAGFAHALITVFGNGMVN